MRLNDYGNEQNNQAGVAYMILGAFFFIAIIVGLIFLFNYKSKTDSEKSASSVVSGENTASAKETDITNEVKEATDIPTEDLLSGSTLTADDLDFWDMYPEEDTDNDTNSTDNQNTTSNATSANKNNDSGLTDKAAAENISTDASEKVTEDQSQGGKYTLIEKSDGTTEWIAVNSYLDKNNYDFTNLTKDSDFLKYSEDGTEISKQGIDISKNQGDIDFTKVKRVGVDFVMIRAGARGYDTGKLVSDSKFSENIAGALAAGLDVGVYFFSQAVTKEEAVEEANLVLTRISGYDITYPIVFDMESIDGDTSRTDKLSKSERTDIATAFLNVIETAGYQPMIYGTKEVLLQKFELGILTGTDIWLSQEKEQPDYPYEFTMLQYSTSGSVLGINGKVDMDISFLDYELK